MSTEPKSFASLGPTLLARKGGAKPAMRPQVAPLAGGQAAALAIDPDALEDLGWNDMGHAEDEHHEAQILTLTPMGKHDLADDDDGEDEPVGISRVESDVHRQQREIVSAIAEPRRRPRRVANDVGRRAAFTLRLDAKRHLKLRLASTVKGKSAQSLVTQALDQFLASIPDIETLAAHVKRDGQ